MVTRKRGNGTCLVVLILLLVPVLSPAQAPDRGPNRFAIMGGLNLAQQGSGMDALGAALVVEATDLWPGDWTYSRERRSGGALGVYFALPLNRRFTLHVEGQYVQRGGRLVLQGRNIDPDYDPYVSLDQEYTFKLDYVEVAALGRFEPWPDAKVRPYLLGGPALGIKAKSNLEFDGGGEVGISSEISSETFGLAAGAGISLDAGSRTRLVLQARYFHGLTDLFIDGPETGARDLAFLAALEFTLNSSGAAAPESGSGSMTPQ